MRLTGRAAMSASAAGLAVVSLAATALGSQLGPAGHLDSAAAHQLAGGRASTGGAAGATTANHPSAVDAGLADAARGGTAVRPARAAEPGHAGTASRAGRAGAHRAARAQIDSGLSGATGSVTVMLELDSEPAVSAYTSAARHGSHRRAVRASRAQVATVERQERSVRRLLHSPHTKATPLFSLHNVYSGVAVRTDADRLRALARVPGIKAIHKMSPKSLADDDYSVMQVRAPQAWQATDDTGAGVTIGVIDTGVDYTHADFGGPGTADDYTSAKAGDAGDPAYPNTAKVASGYDLAGDAYNATGSYSQQTPHQDGNPLDCNGHGTHVAGVAAGYGVDSNGVTYAGPYDESVATSAFRVQPGVAPDATIVPIKVFGCDADATTDLVSEGIDRAVDPDGNGDFSDHLDVINLSLGSTYTSPQDPDAVAAERASSLGVVVVAAAGNDGDEYDAGGSPGNAPSVIAVAASDDNKQIAGFSSRGVRGVGNVKPDITAPGVGINSALIGSGNFGISENENGTSFASPAVAGAAAVVRSRNPTWSVAQVKAALMDTAASGVTAQTGAAAPPMRAGSGLLKVDAASTVSLLAYDKTAPSAVSMSFGPVAVTGTTTHTVTRYLHVVNLRPIALSYSLGFTASSLPTGVTITPGASVVSLNSGQSVDVPVTLSVNPSTLKLKADPTKYRTGSGGYDSAIAEASGWLTLTSRDGRGGAPERVSVYAAPRRASTMSAASTGTVSTVSKSSLLAGSLALSGTGFGSGAATAKGVYGSMVTATQLTASSAQLPVCQGAQAVDCVPFADDRAADIRYVGTASDVPFCAHGSPVRYDTCVGSPGDAAVVSVAINTWGPWRTPAGFATFRVWWDLNHDGVPDAVTYNGRLAMTCSQAGSGASPCPYADDRTFDTDQFVALTDTLDSSGNVTGEYVQPLNNAGGSLDTDPLDSDAMVLPVSLKDLERGTGWSPNTTSRVYYWVTSSTADDGGAQLDQVAGDGLSGNPKPLTMNVVSPALSATGDLGLPELNSDKAGSTYALRLREDPARVSLDLPSGTPSLLLIHHDNVTGSRAQVVKVYQSSSVKLSLSSTSIKTSTTTDKATATVSPSTATGTVTFKDGSKTLATVAVSGGKATFTLPKLSKGTHSITAVYGGSTAYRSVTSAKVSLKVS